MKYLEFPRLTVLTTFLDSKPLGDIVLRGRVEAFSCKSAGKDKKLAKLLQRRYTQELKGIPAEQLEGVMSPLGPMSSASTRKLLINLIATMNASFPDFDFSSLSADEFRVEEMKMAVNIINTRLAAPIEVDDPGALVARARGEKNARCRARARARTEPHLHTTRRAHQRRVACLFIRGSIGRASFHRPPPHP
jgi:hypothetical protein